MLRIASAKCASSAEVFDLLGIANDMLDNFEEAQKAFRRSIELDPRVARPRTNLGVSLLRSGNEAAAVRELEGAIAVDPANVVAHRNLAVCYVRKRKFAQALRSFEVIDAERSPEIERDPGLRLSLLECFLANKLEQRVQSLLPVTSQDVSPALRFSLGTKLAEYGHYEDAIRQFKAIPEDKADSATMFNLGLTYSHLGLFDDARKFYFAAIDRDANHVDAYLRTGMDYSHSGERSKAIPWLLRAWRMAPDRTDSAYALAEELITAKFYQTALGVLEKTSALRPGDPLLSVARGDWLLDQGKTAEATEAYRHALELDPDNTAASVGFARALAADGKTAEATRMLTAVVSHVPENGDANAVLGRLQAAEGNCAAAVPHLLRAWRGDVSKSLIAIDVARYG